MMTKFSQAFFFCLFALLALVSAAPLAKRDVWDPTIISPNASTVWVAGETYNVTWGTDNAPKQITNPNGYVFLIANGSLQTDSPLASNFSLLQGWVTITAPNVTTGNYSIDLFGDSGNWSPDFVIEQLES